MECQEVTVMLKKPSKEEYVLDGARAYHGPTGIEVWYPLSEQQAVKRSLTYRGSAAEYDEGAVVRMAGDLLYEEQRYWKCPLCDAEVDREEWSTWVKAHEEQCKLKEHSVGYECLAFRQEGRARELLGEG